MPGVQGGASSAAMAVNGAAAASPQMQPGPRYAEAQNNARFLREQIAAETNPARRGAMQQELASQEQIIRSMGTQAPQAGPQASAAQAPVGSPRPGPAAPTGPVYVSPEQAERDVQKAKAASRVGAAKMTTDTVKANIDEALSYIGLTSTGLIGAGAKWAPWPTDAGKLDNAVKAVKSALSFDTLQTMRENNPTGGGVGNASDKDIEMLQTTIVSIDPVRDGPELTRKKLLRVKQHYEHWLQLREDSYQKQFGVSAPPLDLTPRDRQVPSSGFKYLGVQGG